jgi:hypothetical protein
MAMLVEFKRPFALHFPPLFTKLTRSGGHTYVHLIESFRDETGRPRQRTVCTLGRLDEAGGQVDSLLKGLLRCQGHARLHGLAATGGVRVGPGAGRCEGAGPALERARF